MWLLKFPFWHFFLNSFLTFLFERSFLTISLFWHLCNISQSSNSATINSPRTVGILTLTPRRRSRGTPTRKETTTSNRATFPTSSSSSTSGSTINLGTTQVCSLPFPPFYQCCCPLYATGRLIAPCSLISGHLFNNAVQVLCNLGWKKSQKWRKTVNNTLKNRYPLAVASVSGFPPRTPTSATRWLPFNACRSVTPPPRP